MESRNQDKKIAEMLAEFIVNQNYEDLPKETIEKVKHYINDRVVSYCEVCNRILKHRDKITILPMYLGG